MTRKVGFALLLVFVLGVVLWMGVSQRNQTVVEREPETVPMATPREVMTIPVSPSPTPEEKVVKKEPKKPAVKIVKEKPPEVAKPVMAPPPEIEVHEELIPKEIKIVRVYYASTLVGPGSTIEFDINGSGFTKEFEQMINVVSGSSDVAVESMRLITVNQIHARLVVNSTAPTAVSFPRVLIGGKVVFLAEEPFAVIRPGEVLNLVFTEMGEDGRTGRFKVYTNLTEGMYKKFTIEVSTPAIVVDDFRTELPFLVDAKITIGRVGQSGHFGISVKLRDKVIWNRPDIIRVVRPNFGQTGLIQRVQAVDGFHRPGDTLKLTIQGSGFRRSDVNIIKANVKGFDILNSCFTYVAPGRMELSFQIPAKVDTTNYSMTLTANDEKLMSVPNAFRVVEKNWTKSVQVIPALHPGESSSLKLSGRGMNKKFVESLRVEVDEENLNIGKFKMVSSREARAEVTVGPDVRPGDYWIRITSEGQPVEPHFGSIIQVSAKAN